MRLTRLTSSLRRSLGTGRLVLSLVLLAGCTSTIPLHDAESTRRKLAADLQLSPEQIQDYTRCLVGKTRGESASRRLECVYMRTPEWAAVLDYDTRTRTFARAFTFDRLTRGAALQERSTVWGAERQLQIRLKDDSVLIVEFVNAELGTLGMGDEALAAYEHLRKTGIASMSPIPFVNRPPQPRTIVIPIYVPAR